MLFGLRLRKLHPPPRQPAAIPQKWGAGIDTPKYSGIRKMSEVVVRVNNAWAR